ncbi:Neprilysin-11 [Trichinella pseudospiralis]
MRCYCEALSSDLGRWTPRHCPPDNQHRAGRFTYVRMQPYRLPSPTVRRKWSIVIWQRVCQPSTSTNHCPHAQMDAGHRLHIP